MDHQIDIKSVNKDSARSELTKALHIALFKPHVMHEVAKGGAKATTFGYIIIIAAAVLGLLGSQVFGVSVGFGSFKIPLMSALISAVFQVVCAVIGIHLMNFIAVRLFKGKALHMEFFRVAAYAMVVSFLTVVPMLGIIAGLWSLVLVFVILKTIHHLTSGGAIGTILVTALIFIVLSALATRLLGFGAFGGFGGRMMNGGSGNPFNYNGNFKMNVTDPGTGKKGSVEFNEGGVNFKDETTGETGSVKYDGNTMKFKGPDGKEVEVNIPIPPAGN